MFDNYSIGTKWYKSKLQFYYVDTNFSNKEKLIKLPINIIMLTIIYKWVSRNVIS